MLITLDIDGVIADTPSYHPWEDGGRERWLHDLPNLPVRWPEAIEEILAYPQWLPKNCALALVSSRPPETHEQTIDWLLKNSPDPINANLPSVLCTGSKEAKLSLLNAVLPAIHFDDDPRLFLNKNRLFGMIFVPHPSWNDWFERNHLKPFHGVNTWHKAKQIIETLAQLSQQQSHAEQS